MRSALAILGLLFATTSVSALEVPRLTGRVIDLADVLSPTTESALEATLAAHEDSTSNQIVVLTIPSLEGEILEPYATRVFREWGLGQKDRNNGVLLLVVVGDRKVRIEVGYGLEGDLTDATAGTIIRSEITPRFKEVDFDAGVLDGATAIVGALEGTYAPSSRPVSLLKRVGFWLVFGLLVPPLLLVLTIYSGTSGIVGDILSAIYGTFVSLSLSAALWSGFAGWNVDTAFLMGLLIVIAFVIINRLAERSAGIGGARKHQRAKSEAFSAARKSGRRSVVVDGTSYDVPDLSSSSSSYSGGGGSSGGGGASGSW